MAGSHHDVFHRDLRSPTTNPDIAHLDELIDELVEEGDVDTSRIYIMGWSNGGFFAQLYAIARHETATPGGNRIAAAAVFTAADPFHEAVSGDACRLDPYPVSSVPIFIVSRACDLVACDERQAESLQDQGVEVAPGAVVETWMDDLASRVRNPNAEHLIVSGDGRAVTSCTAPAFCGPAIATLNHARWPDGVADGGDDHEEAMLEFLRLHTVR